MKAKDLVPGTWYYCPQWDKDKKYFCFIKQIDNYVYKIIGLNGKYYCGFYTWNNDFKKLNDEKKLELL